MFCFLSSCNRAAQVPVLSLRLPPYPPFHCPTLLWKDRTTSQAKIRAAYETSLPGWVNHDVCEDAWFGDGLVVGYRFPETSLRHCRGGCRWSDPQSPTSHCNFPTR